MNTITKGQSIFDFKNGDIIVRVEKAKPYNDGTRDGSYRGEPMTFDGIANNMIYLRTVNKDFLGGKRSLGIELWSEGWAKYVDLYKVNSIAKAKTFLSHYKEVFAAFFKSK